MLAISLRVRLMGAFLIIAIVAVGLIAVFIRQASVDDLRHAVMERNRDGMIKAMTEHYIKNQTWDGALDLAYQMVGMPVPPPSKGRASPPPPPPAGMFVVLDERGSTVVPLPGMVPSQRVAPDVVSRGIPLIVDGRQVGTLIPAERPPWLGPDEQLYLDRTDRALGLGSIGAIVLALLVGFFLARQLTRPLLDLTNAAGAMANGDLEQEVSVRSRDEIGQLGTAFNLMSSEVTRQVHLRRQMTADVAHDLRTPLTVIAGYLEAMKDGDLAPTPARLELVYAEVEHLQQMVADLGIMSRADAGELRLNLQQSHVEQVLGRAYDVHHHRVEQNDIALRIDERSDDALIEADEMRIARVFNNLIDNALRHTSAGGSITLSARSSPGRVDLSIKDTGSGIPADDLPHIFNRFYRGNKARSSGEGRSRLGLAIVHALVEAHGGTIQVESVVGEGTQFTVTLPATMVDRTVAVSAA